MYCLKPLCTVSLLALISSAPVLANNFGESLAWQFQTTADKANQALVADIIAKKKSGYYAAPTYTTNIGRQYNCNVSASAAGNSGSNSTVANSPSTSGATAKATGNESTASVDGHGAPLTSPGGINGTQSNSGTVHSGVAGDTETNVRGDAWQALNSNQTNSGSQTASVGGSTGCAFGALN